MTEQRSKKMYSELTSQCPASGTAAVVPAPSPGLHLPSSPLAQPARSSPLVLPESSQNIWLMVRFCRAVTSEIMSLDLRRSSICTDCHSPKDRGQKLKKKVISCLQHAPLEELPRNYLSVCSRKDQDPQGQSLWVGEAALTTHSTHPCQILSIKKESEHGNCCSGMLS
uniref:Uncharacterized protein n=1 Tax=Athene cunicularia TaxID=194338 RepID=A0A663M852_ATHCN